MKPSDLAKLKPNAKGDLILDGKTIKRVWYAHLGRHAVSCPGEPDYWDTKEEAMAAAERARALCQGAEGGEK